MPMRLNADENPTEDVIADLCRRHLEKIAASDTILAVNHGGYIGEAVKKEIEYAKSLGKKIIYTE